MNDNALMLKYSVYGAVSRAAADLCDYVDFPGIFREFLVPESADKRRAEFTTLRKRIAQLLGSWSDVKMTDDDTRRLAIQVLVTMMQFEEEDLAVRLVACRNLRFLIDSWDFRPETQMPATLIDACIKACLSLLTSLDEVENRMLVLNLLSVIVERIGSERVLPFVPMILQRIPELWVVSSKAGSSDISCYSFQSGILCLLNVLVDVSKGTDSSLQSFVCPMIAYATSMEQEAHVYLLDDALPLWHGLLCHAQVLTLDLKNLIPGLIEMLEITSENLRVVLKLLECYVVFQVPDFLTVNIYIMFLWLIFVCVELWESICWKDCEYDG